MQQVLQSLKTGKTSIREIACPQVSPHHVLIASRASLISAGTERMLVNFGKSSLINKARSQPEKVKQVMNKVKTDGLRATFDAVMTKLDEEIPMGYSNAGVVIAVGDGVTRFAVGDRVVSNGPHAEIISVGENLVAPIPENVTDNAASFTVLGSIALNGIRLAEPTLGETMVVIGLGLLGLLTAQCLMANGCRVIGVDVDAEKVTFAKRYGFEVYNANESESLIDEIKRKTNDVGADAVIITASTNSAAPLTMAAQCSRVNGRVVLVGVVKCEFSRQDFYNKSITFRVASAYGPGRYDEDYECKGHDYPIAHVRWTANRNFMAFLDLLNSGRICVDDLITSEFDITDASQAYDKLSQDKSGYGILLRYPQDLDKQSKLANQKNIFHSNVSIRNNLTTASIAVIGAGNYTKLMVLPILKKIGKQCKVIVSRGGVSAAECARKFSLRESSTDVASVLRRDDINTIVITTRHNSHAKFVKQSLQAGKNVFVEKPLCLTQEELSEIANLITIKSQLRLIVGFNRRFSPHIQKMKQQLGRTHAPKNIIMTINAGFLPKDNWNNDKAVGGGRLLAEGCHFIDLCRHLIGFPITTYDVKSMAHQDNDSWYVTLGFTDGSVAQINYVTNGHKAYPKETLEVFTEQRVLKCENFRKLTGFGWSVFKKFSTRKQDKGHEACMKAFLNSIELGTPSPIPIEEILEVSRVTIELAEKINS